ncbi:Right handed beta helix region [Enhydrobacter aerosaccus]|uniref:Right handed beta helix region n=1 Tax=Enhydrobacter aerosaccus TaxID=225324 RepID=A0A1T4RNP6_9HYPH|nr:glycosyl hydrolase family 28-related protein [Enhydrobacter aerosaccus]SKA17582.1 Right handed beta helix region [Enhydrobacter aerosaccus]
MSVLHSRPSPVSSFVTASGTTTPRRLTDRFAEEINVKDFGAIGDGVADDTAALQAAAAAAQSLGRQWLAPAGRYKVSAPIPVTTSGASLGGAPGGLTTIFAAGNFTAVFTLSGTALEATSISDIKIDTSGTTTQCINVALATNTVSGTRPLRFERLWLYGDLPGALFYSAGNLLSIKGCTFGPNSPNTVALHMDMWNLNNIVEGNDIMGAGPGVHISKSGSDVAPQGIDILGNKIVSFGAAYNIKIDCAAEEIVIAKNICDQALTTAVDLALAYQTTLEGNWFGLQGTANIAVTLHETTSQVEVSGNTFGPCGIGLAALATASSRVSSVGIHGNQFAGCAESALQLDSVLGATITGNKDTSSSANGSWVTLATYGPGKYTFDNSNWSTNGLAAFDPTSSYRFGNDTGIVGRNRGKAVVSSAATSVTINHGLFTTPSCVRVSPEGNTGAFFVSAIGGTSFTVTWSNSIACNIHWDAEV